MEQDMTHGCSQPMSSCPADSRSSHHTIVLVQPELEKGRSS